MANVPSYRIHCATCGNIPATLSGDRETRDLNRAQDRAQAHAVYTNMRGQMHSVTVREAVTR